MNNQTIQNSTAIDTQVNINYVEKLIYHPDGRYVPFLAPPKPVYDLIGRERVLQEVKQQLFSGRIAALSALNGLPGVGKTALAIALAYDQQMMAHFSDGVLWAGLGPDPDPLRYLGSWMAALGVPDELIRSQHTCEERRDMLKRVIGARRILLVIDDAWSANDARWFKVGGRHCAHLLTTRQPQIALEFAETADKRILVRELTPEDGLRLLEQFAENLSKEEEDAAKELVKVVDCLPLALILVGRHLRKKEYRQSPDRVRQVIEQVQARMRLTLAAESLKQYPGLRGASVSLQATIALTEEALDNQSRTVLRKLSVFAAKPDTFATEAALVVTNTHVEDEILDNLFEYGMLEPGGLDRYTIHQTISDYAGLKLHDYPEEEQETQDRHSQYFAEFVKDRETPLKGGNPKDTLAEVETDIANIRLMWKRSIEQTQRETIEKACPGLQKFYWLRGWYQEGEKTFGQALERFDQQTERISEQENALLLANLALFRGKFLQSFDQYAPARRLYVRSLALQRKIHGKEHLEVAEPLNDLASLYAAQGNYTKAEQYYIRTLRIRRQHGLPDSDPDVTKTAAGLARLYQYQGKYAQAEELFLQSLQAIKSSGATDEPFDLAMVYNNLAVLYRIQQKNTLAEGYYHKALNIWEHVLGKEHAYVATVTSNLGELYHTQGRYIDAEKTHLRALKIRRNVFGEEHPDVAQSLHNLAAVFHSEGRYEEAQKFYRLTLAIQEKFLGKQHPVTATSLCNLSELCRLRKKYEEAERLGQDALTIRKQALGIQHLDVASSLNNLGLLYYEQERYAEAEEYYQQAVNIQRALFETTEHPYVAETLENQAVLYHAWGKYAEAEHLYEQVLAIQKHIFDAPHPTVARLFLHLARLYEHRRQVQKAYQYYQHAFQTVDRLETLAQQHYADKEYARAESCYRQILSIKQDVLGKNHKDVASLTSNLGLLYKLQGKYDEAERFYQQAIALFDQIAGPTHPSRLLLSYNLALLYYAQKRYQEAEPLFSQVYNMRDGLSEIDKQEVKKFWDDIRKKLSGQS